MFAGVVAMVYLLRCTGLLATDRGVYGMQKTENLSASEVLGAVEALEAQAPAVNAKYGKGGLGVGAFASK